VLAALLSYLVALTVSMSPRIAVLVALPVLVLALKGRVFVACLLTIICVVTITATGPLHVMTPGEKVIGEGVLVTDVIQGKFGPYALIAMDAGPILANLPHHAAGSRGERVLVDGVAVGEPGTIAGRRHRGAVRVGEFEVVGDPSSPVMVVGNAMRDRVTTRLMPLEGGRGLLAGFLVGDTSGVDPIDQDAMRRAGLSHFTAVSGSNVALYLSLVFVALGPIGIGPRRRAAVGLLALPLFAAATRFEPSVLRASVMAGLVLGGRLVGIAMETWQVLSASVVGLLILDPTLVSNVGFQLSVAATAGVMVGARWPGARSLPGKALRVTLGAQAGVAPLLILHFEQVPLLSPLANLLAGPLVAVSTVVGAVGVVGPGPLVALGAWIAGVVLELARLASGWPQIGLVGLLVCLAMTGIYLAFPHGRGVLVISTAVLVAWLLVGGRAPLPSPGVVVLDVGQGDSILIAGGDGHFALVDGGPDPVRLVESLRRYGVRRLDLMVLTHVHADHATGLTGLVGRIPIGQVWADTEPHETASSAELLQVVAESGIPVSRPQIGDRLHLGGLLLTVEGPLRRYASPNDQSIVLRVDGSARSMILSGDIETVAQAELAHLRADVLKVPHQGAGTSDAGWLEAVGADLAVISVGPNDFGHPVAWVIETLEEGGAAVLRTDEVGDVPVPLS
jgi:competence protein ComEC